MNFKVTGWSQIDQGAPVSLRCPSCRQLGTFESLQNPDISTQEGINLGQRRCPNPACQAHIFFAKLGPRLLVSYPAERIDFDATNVPPPIVTALEEAITCHADSCFVAARIMV